MICDYCEKKFSSRSNYLAHVQLHERSTWKCEQCTMFFIEECELMEHYSSAVHRRRSLEVRKRKLVIQENDCIEEIAENEEIDIPVFAKESITNSSKNNLFIFKKIF